MLVGVASGTYSSIFIASPVLTAWKEREPQYRARRRAIEDAMGYVPPFPEENVVAKLDEEAEREEGGEPGRAGTGVTDDSPRQPGPPEAIGAADPREDGEADGDGAAAPSPADEAEEQLVGASAADDEERRAKAERRAQRKARQQKRRKKHGRHR
jgi:SecD/SecF fusion protein